MDIALLTNKVDRPWDPAQVLGQGLGGSEEACVLWAEAVARNGHSVTVYGSFTPNYAAMNSEAKLNGVYWRPREAFSGSRHTVLVTWKEREPWLTGGHGAARMIHWSSDVEYPHQWTRPAMARLDAVIALSQAHGRALSWMGHKVRVQPQGVDGHYVGLTPPPPTGNRAIYCASPDRGLDFTLQNWARIKAKLGLDELLVSYVFGGPQPGKPAPDITILPPLPVAQWDQVLASCRYWIHPVQNIHGPVPNSELFCLNAVKALAFGVVPVVPAARLADTGLGDTVKTYVDLSELILHGDASIKHNPFARMELPLSWDQVVEKYWEPLFSGQSEQAA